MISRFKTAYIRLLHSIRLDSTTTKKSLYVSLGLSLKQKQQQNDYRPHTQKKQQQQQQKRQSS